VCGIEIESLIEITGTGEKQAEVGGSGWLALYPSCLQNDGLSVKVHGVLSSCSCSVCGSLHCWCLRPLHLSADGMIEPRPILLITMPLCPQLMYFIYVALRFDGCMSTSSWWCTPANFELRCSCAMWHVLGCHVRCCEALSLADVQVITAQSIRHGASRESRLVGRCVASFNVVAFL
jgi:hypothetical protein